MHASGTTVFLLWCLRLSIRVDFFTRSRPSRTKVRCREHRSGKSAMVPKTTCKGRLCLALKVVAQVPQTRRGRLVAYGARLESVLSASSREFESLSLRQEYSSDPTRSPKVLNLWSGSFSFSLKCYEMSLVLAFPLTMAMEFELA